MQIQKVKQGNKLVKSLFGKYDEIPEEWEYTRLIETCSRKPEYGAGESAIEKNPKLPRYVRITDLTDDGTLKEEEWMSISEEASQDYILNEGDILFARTGATVGKTYLYQQKDGRCAFAGYLIRFVPDKSKLLPSFLSQITHSTFYWKWLKSIQTWGVQPNVNAEQYSNMPILLPPIQEQQKITSILSNVDSLISQTQKEIEQTQRLKKGLMQRLMTKGIGHTKFKKVKSLFGKYEEIPEEWEIKTTSSIINITMGQSPPSESYNEDQKGLPFYQGVTDFGTMYPNPTVWCTDSRKIAEENSILFSVRAPVGEINLTKTKCCLGRGVAALNPLGNDLWYCYYLVNQNKNRFLVFSQGTTYDAINQGEIAKTRLPYTKNIQEQQKIASILSNVDSHIQKQQEYKSKLESLKKSLMQKLLTGQMRIKI